MTRAHVPDQRSMNGALNSSPPPPPWRLYVRGNYLKLPELTFRSGCLCLCLCHNYLSNYAIVVASFFFFFFFCCFGGGGGGDLTTEYTCNLTNYKGWMRISK